MLDMFHGQLVFMVIDLKFLSNSQSWRHGISTETPYTALAKCMQEGYIWFHCISQHLCLSRDHLCSYNQDNKTREKLDWAWGEIQTPGEVVIHLLFWTMHVIFIISSSTIFFQKSAWISLCYWQCYMQYISQQVHLQKWNVHFWLHRSSYEHGMADS